MALKKVLDGKVMEMTTEEEAEFKASLPTAKEIAADKLEVLRDERDIMLSQSDWTQSRDVTLSNDADWKTYRQALRDITKDYKSLEDVKWPEKPE